MHATIEQTLKTTIQDAMSPQAVALMIAHLQTCDGNSAAHREVAWFRKQLVKVAGGPEAVNALFDEVGV